MIFELPLHEQTRVLIRLEYLFDHLTKLVKKDSFESIYLSLCHLDEILSVIERNNLKKYLLTEIKEVSKALIAWRNNSRASVDKIDNLLNQLNTEKSYIESGAGRAPDLLIANDFLKNFRQKCNIPGGTSVVDFPRFHYWLQQNDKNLQNILKELLKSLDCFYRPIKLILSIIRQSATTSRQVAQAGFYQCSLGKNVEYKLIQVNLEDNSPCFAEISGGRYHITIRMVHEADNGTIAQYAEDVEFRLSTCKI